MNEFGEKKGMAFGDMRGKKFTRSHSQSQMQVTGTSSMIKHGAPMHKRTVSPHEVYLKNDDQSGSDGDFYDNNFDNENAQGTLPVVEEYDDAGKEAEIAKQKQLKEF